MDPIAAQQRISPSLRPSLALSGDLPAVLQHGRVVAGEVMQKLDGGSLLLGLGGHRVPAQSGVELAVGERFLARVEQLEGGGTVLKLLGARGAEAEPKLLAALRDVVGQDRPVGELLKGLAQSLRGASRDAAGGARLEGLAGEIEGHVFKPGSSGAELQNLVANAGMHYEAALLAYALKGSSGLTAGQELQALAKKLAGEAALLLGQVHGPVAPAAVGPLGEKLRRLIEGFLRTKHGKTAGRAELAAGLERVLVESAAPRARSAELQAQIARLVGDSALLEALAREGGKLSDNLKAQLLGALEELPEGSSKQSIQRALASIESEQLLNVARKEFQDAWHLSLPVPDGERWATAHLFYRENESQREGDEGEEEHSVRRLTLAVDFSRLGPLRAELGITSQDLALSITTSRDDVATRLRTDLEGLAETLTREGRRVRIAVRTGGPEDVAVDSLAQDVRWLRENHILDCEG